MDGLGYLCTNTLIFCSMMVCTASLSRMSVSQRARHCASGRTDGDNDVGGDDMIVMLMMTIMVMMVITMMIVMIVILMMVITVMIFS